MGGQHLKSREKDSTAAGVLLFNTVAGSGGQNVKRALSAASRPYPPCTAAFVCQPLVGGLHA